MAITQIDGDSQIRNETIYDAQIAPAAAIALSKLAEAVIQADGGQAFTADQSMGGKKLTNVATPISGTDATNKDYVDLLVTAGISWKPLVKLATTTTLPAYAWKKVLTANMTGAFGGTTGYTTGDILVLTGPTGSALGKVVITATLGVVDGISSVSNGGYGYATGVVATVAETGTGDNTATVNIASVTGDFLLADGKAILAVDGVNTVLNDRILVKNEAIGARNGIYKVTTEGTAGAYYVLTRTVDADISSEVDSGIACLVQQGSTLADLGFVQTADAPVINVDPLVFVQFTVLGTTLAGLGLYNAAPNSIDVGAGDGIQVNTNSVAIKLDTTSGLNLTGGDLAVGAGDGIQVDAASITVKLDGASLLKSGSGVKVDYSIWITRETPSGSLPGTVFTTANAVLAGTEQVFLNGLLQEAGGADYTFSSTNTITFVDTVKANRRVRVNYIKA